MTPQQIRALGPRISEYLDEFAGCFVSPDTRYHLTEYVHGQLSNLPRKSVEPIAHLADVPPRTLQEFLSLSDWDDDGLRDAVQRIVARDHADAQAIAIVDESGHPKKGNKTACVQRQYCGASGKIDNCVMSVHLCHASFDGTFRAMLDSDLYLPQSWPRRRASQRGEDSRAGGVPPQAPDRAGPTPPRGRDNGLRFGWIVADEWYGAKPSFVEGLEALGLRFVLEIPRNLMGWRDCRRTPTCSAARCGTSCGGRRRCCASRGDVVHVKDTGMGAMVWEVRAAPFWTTRGDASSGRTGSWRHGTGWTSDDEVLPVERGGRRAAGGVRARGVRAVAGRADVAGREDGTRPGPLRVRGYDAVLRHLRITQVSHLFLARPAERLAGGKPGRDGLPGARRGQRPARRAAAQHGRSETTPEQGGGDSTLHPGTQRRGSGITYEHASSAIAETQNQLGTVTMLHSDAERVAR